LANHRSVFHYQDYRVFLRDFYLARKREAQGYSYSKFSSDAGIESPNLLKLVMDGGKNLTTTTIQKFAKGLRLKLNETQYFEALVLWNQAQSEDEKSYYGQRIRNFRESYSQRSAKVDARFGLYDHPLLPLIFAALAGTHRSETKSTLAAHFGKAPELNEWAEALFSKGILRVEEDCILANFDHVIFSEKIAGRTLKTYLRNQLKLSRAAFNVAFDRSAKFYSHSMSLRPEHFPELQEMIKDFIDRTNQTFADDSGGAVQINIQSFLASPKICAEAASKLTCHQ